ncbi:MAG TPA: protein phosphatase 2C domain-containing protein [Fimbriimonadaceae bacterium]|nr:protein phosphatase 2C domain-containing protein [Fimbriimonadaceae bacterium]
MDEVTADYSLDQLVEPVSLRVVPKVSVGAKTDLGRVRENNEDKFEFYIPEDERTLATKGLIFVVCDGMGGHAAGQIASELACKTFIDVYLNHPSTEVETALRGAVVAANRYVFDVSTAVPGRKGMGTTLTALLLVQDRGYLCQVGDSRLYRLKDDELVQISEDHTWVDDAIRQGLISPDEATTHPYRHVLTRAVGTEASVPCDIESFGR